MTTTHLDLITTDDVLLTRQTDVPNTWHYLPLRPHPQRTPDGAPSASIIEVDGTALVALSCQLDPPGDEVEQLRNVIAADFPSRAPVVLQSAVNEVVTISVRAGRDVIAESTGSGFAPFSAAFSITASGATRDALVASFAGSTGHVTVDYLLDTVHGTTRASADIGTWFIRTDPEEVVPC